MKAYTRTLPSRGWLEVSIDSTLPTSPVGISKNVFDLSPLETTLPNMENGEFIHSNNQISFSF